MPKCANCQRDALYTYSVTSDYLIHYCQLHLPKFLTSQKQAGQLSLVVTTPVTETVTATEPEPSATVEEVSDATPAEDTPPTKKTTTSKK